MKTYKVIGDSVVFGHEKGDTFEAELSEFDEWRLIKGGHIEATTAGKANNEEENS